VIEAVAAADVLEDFRLLVVELLRNQDGDRPADDLFGRVAEQALGGAVPADDDAVEGLADDGVVGRVNDGSKNIPGICGRISDRTWGHEPLGNKLFRQCQTSKLGAMTGMTMIILTNATLEVLIGTPKRFKNRKCGV